MLIVLLIFGSTRTFPSMVDNKIRTFFVKGCVQFVRNKGVFTSFDIIIMYQTCKKKIEHIYNIVKIYILQKHIARGIYTKHLNVQ